MNPSFAIEALGRAVLSQAPAIVVLLDLEGRIDYVNPFFEQLTGYTLAEIRGRDWFRTMLPQPEQERVRAVFLRAVEHRPTRGNVNAVVTRDGRQRVIEWNDDLYKDEHGAPVGLLAIGIDVTARVETETALRRTHEHLKATLAAIPDLLFEVDREGRIFGYHAHRPQDLAVAPERILGERFADLLPSEAAQACQRAIDLAAEHGHGLGPAYSLQMPAGPRWYEPSAALKSAAERGAARFVLLARDVTERVEAESERRAKNEEVRASRAQLAEAQRIAQIGSWELDIETLQARWSDELYRIVEVEPTRTVGLFEAFLERLHPDDRAAGLARFERAVADGVPVDETARLVFADGRVKHIRQRAGRMAIDRGAGGRAARMVGTMEDITERVIAEQALHQSEARLKEAQRIAKLGSWELDLRTNSLSWSDEVFRIFEIDASRFGASYEAFLALIHPEDREPVNQAYTRSVELREPYTIQHRLRMPDGRIKHVVENCETSYDAEGKPVRSIGTVQDVTAQIQAEHRVRRIINAMAPYVAILDTEGRVLEVNHGPLEHYRLQRDKRIGQYFVDSPPWAPFAESRQRIREAIAQVSAGQSVRGDFISRLPNGDDAYTDIMFAPLRDDAGNVECIIVSGIDISGRKASEKRLQQSEARYRSVLNALSEAVVLLSKERTLIACNDAACDLFGVARDTPIARGQQDADRLIVAFDGSRINFDDLPGPVALRTGERQTNRLLGFRRPDGSVRWHSVNAEPVGDVDPGHGASQAVVSFADITERIEAERALQQTRDRLEATLQAIPDLLFETDREHRYIDLRAMRRDLLAADPEVLMGAAVADVLPAQAWSVVRAALEEALASGLSFGRQYRLDLPGGERWFELSVARKNDSAGGHPTCVSLARDITERKQAEAAVRQLNTELEERVQRRTSELEAANQELKTFAYSVSHDLKAPLRSIDGYTRLVIDDWGGQLGQDGLRMLQTVRDATRQMSQLIDDLLSYSQLERQPVVGEATDLYALVQGILAERSEELRARNVEVVLHHVCRSVRADRNALKMALRNLVENALKFTHTVANPRIEIGELDGERSCVIWVRDNGIGFDMRFSERIFEMFQRLHRADQYQGTGVGLAIVRKAAQRIGGRAWAESKPGEGATFYLEVPK